MTAADPLRLIGSTVADLRFDECVHAGGFGYVYRGRRQDDERVAIKCFPLGRLQRTNAAMRDTILARFGAEARLSARLSSENRDLVRCLASGELPPATGRPERIPYLVLEWLNGRTLEDDLDDRRRRGARGRLLPEVLDLFEPAVLALAHAHAANATHRDVRPTNLMLAHTGGGTRLKVLDFGVAKSLCDEPGLAFAQDVTTDDGDRLCSPLYGAPEQFSPEIGVVGPRTDVYSLALVLLETLRGERVRAAATPAQGLVAALDPRFGSPTASSLGIKLAGAVEEVLARAVARNPLDRPANAGVFWQALREVARKNRAAEGPLVSTAVGGAGQERSAAPAPKPKPLVDPSKFSGTLIMDDAPRGALHLLTPTAPGGSPGAPSSSAPSVSMREPAPASAPRSAPASAPTSRAEPPLSGRAMNSPLAASLGPSGFSSPLTRLPAGVAPPAIVGLTGPKSATPASDDDVAFRPTQLASDLPMLPTPPNAAPPSQSPASLSPASAGPMPPTPALAPEPSRSNAVIVGLLFLLLIAVVAIAIALWRAYP